ncbi:MAG: response regulator transcription factor [Tannerella sp.]|nr:response regulator transcription factor [Tannerella sp.]
MNAKTDKTLILADNQPITRLGITTLWNRTFPGCDIVLAKEKSELMTLLTKYPDALVLIDYTLFDLHGIDSLIIIGMRFANARWILFSEDLSETFLRRIMLEQQFGVVMKDASVEEITQAIRDGMSNSRFLCERVRNILKTQKETLENTTLTQTEREILKSIAQGKTSQMIAAERCSSVHTISTHRKNIFRKIGVNNLLEATKYAVQAGIVDVTEYYI